MTLIQSLIPILGHGLNCPDAKLEAEGFPSYKRPVEIEVRSSGFLAPHHREHRKQRVVLLCTTREAPEILRDYVDVLELQELDRVLREVA